MGAQRTKHFDLPTYLYPKGGAFHYIRSFGGVKIIRSLGTSREKAIARAHELNASFERSGYRPNGLRDRVAARDGYVCVYCGSTEQLEVDHIVPVKRGGATTIRNLVLACKRCNQAKSDDHPIGFFIRLLAEARGE